MATNNQKGFTAVEMIILAPILVLVIGAFVASAVVLTGQSLSLRERNTLISDTQTALDTIESDVNTANSFLTTTGSLTAPQGSNDLTTPATATAAFTNTTSGQPDALILQSGVTSKGRNDPGRSLVYNGSGTCNPANGVLYYKSVYMLRSNILYKRTIVPTSAACLTPWQQNSCDANLVSTYSSVCKIEDEQLLDDVSGITIQYFSDSTSTTPLAASAAASADDVSFQIDTSKTSGSGTVTYSATRRATKLN